MDAAAFHERLTRLGLKQHEAAEKLGLSPAGLSRQLRGHRPVSRQTEMLLEGLERERRSVSIHEERQQRLDGRFERLDQRLDHLDGRVRRLDLVDADADTDAGRGP